MMFESTFIIEKEGGKEREHVYTFEAPTPEDAILVLVQNVRKMTERRIKSFTSPQPSQPKA